MSGQQNMINQIIDRVNDFNRRMRDIEEKVRNLSARVNTLDETLMNKTKDLNNDIQDLNDEITELRDRIANMEVDITELNKEKRKMATKKDFEEMENYMELMNPIKSNFTTQSQVEDMIKDENFVSKDEVEKIVDSRLKSKEE